MAEEVRICLARNGVVSGDWLRWQRINVDALTESQCRVSGESWDSALWLRCREQLLAEYHGRVIQDTENNVTWLEFEQPVDLLAFGIRYNHIRPVLSKDSVQDPHLVL